VSVVGAVAGGVVGTLVLTTALRAASELGLTRMDIPFLLGTAFTDNRMHAQAAGWALHFLAGLVFAFAYYAAFRLLGEAGWWLGAAFGLLHGAFAGTALVNILLPLVHPRMGSAFSSSRESPWLEPPGFLLLNYGRATPLVTLAAHVAYGAIVGGFVSLAA
jgi:hypothetical protein